MSKPKKKVILSAQSRAAVPEPPPAAHPSYMRGREHGKRFIESTNLHDFVDAIAGFKAEIREHLNSYREKMERESIIVNEIHNSLDA